MINKKILNRFRANPKGYLEMLDKSQLEEILLKAYKGLRSSHAVGFVTVPVLEALSKEFEGLDEQD